VLRALPQQRLTGLEQPREGTAGVTADGLEPANGHAENALLLVIDDARPGRTERNAENALRLPLVIWHGYLPGLSVCR
jgi:hypothetical protein